MIPTILEKPLRFDPLYGEFYYGDEKLRRIGSGAGRQVFGTDELPFVIKLGDEQNCQEARYWFNPSFRQAFGDVCAPTLFHGPFYMGALSRPWRSVETINFQEAHLDAREGTGGVIRALRDAVGDINSGNYATLPDGRTIVWDYANGYGANACSDCREVLEEAEDEDVWIPEDGYTQQSHHHSCCTDCCDRCNPEPTTPHSCWYEFTSNNQNQFCVHRDHESCPEYEG